MQSSVLLCISTLLDGANHYSKMIALTGPDGKKVFESIAITLVCDACLKTVMPSLITQNSPQFFNVVRLVVTTDRLHVPFCVLSSGASGAVSCSISNHMDNVLPCFYCSRRPLVRSPNPQMPAQNVGDTKVD